jgi:steroid 5-alpha reductase family enzyme
MPNCAAPQSNQTTAATLAAKLVAATAVLDHIEVDAGALAMFLGASIPMMEARSLERRPGYQDVVDRVSLFVPRPPRRTTGRAG